jgi:hypothetical protein
MSFGGWWSKSRRGRHAPHRRSKWLRRREREEKELEVEQDYLGRSERRGPPWLD